MEARKVKSLTYLDREPCLCAALRSVQTYRIVRYSEERRAEAQEMQSGSFSTGAHTRACPEYFTQSTPIRFLPPHSPLAGPRRCKLKTAARSTCKVAVKATQESLVQVNSSKPAVPCCTDLGACTYMLHMRFVATGSGTANRATNAHERYPPCKGEEALVLQRGLTGHESSFKRWPDTHENQVGQQSPHMLGKCSGNVHQSCHQNLFTTLNCSG